VRLGDRGGHRTRLARRPSELHVGRGQSGGIRCRAELLTANESVRGPQHGHPRNADDGDETDDKRCAGSTVSDSRVSRARHRPPSSAHDLAETPMGTPSSRCSSSTRAHTRSPSVLVARRAPGTPRETIAAASDTLSPRPSIRAASAAASCARRCASPSPRPPRLAASTRTTAGSATASSAVTAPAASSRSARSVDLPAGTLDAPHLNAPLTRRR